MEDGEGFIESSAAENSTSNISSPRSQFPPPILSLILWINNVVHSRSCTVAKGLGYENCLSNLSQPSSNFRIEFVPLYM